MLFCRTCSDKARKHFTLFALIRWCLMLLGKKDANGLRRRLLTRSASYGGKKSNGKFNLCKKRSRKTYAERRRMIRYMTSETVSYRRNGMNRRAVHSATPFDIFTISFSKTFFAAFARKQTSKRTRIRVFDRNNSMAIEFSLRFTLNQLRFFFDCN